MWTTGRDVGSSLINDGNRRCHLAMAFAFVVYLSSLDCSLDGTQLEWNSACGEVKGIQKKTVVVESKGHVVFNMRMRRGWMVFFFCFAKLLSTPTGTCLNKSNKVDGEERRNRMKLFWSKCARMQGRKSEMRMRWAGI